MRRLVSWPLLPALLLLAAPVNANPFLGFSYLNGRAHTSRIYFMDAVEEKSGLLGDAEFWGTQSAARGPGGEIYVSAQVLGPEGPPGYTGARLFIFGGGTMTSIETSPPGVANALAADADAPLLYAVFGRRFGIIDLTTREIEFLETNAEHRIRGMAASENGILYGWDLDLGLVTISRTGIVTDVNPLVGGGAHELQALAFDGDRLFGAHRALFEIDIGTGTAAEIPGTDNVVGIRGLVALPEPVVEIEIDILPWSDSNRVPVLAGKSIAVAILGSEDFDVAEVDTGTLAFGPSGAPPAPGIGVKDIDGDGIPDLASFYRVEETGIAIGDQEACVTGETLDGTDFEGCDAIDTGPHCGLGFELVVALPVLIPFYRRRVRRDQPAA